MHAIILYQTYKGRILDAVQAGDKSFWVAFHPVYICITYWNARQLLISYAVFMETASWFAAPESSAMLRSLYPL